MTSEPRGAEGRRPQTRGPEIERIGSTLGPYRLLAPLGAGGMATVFSAMHMGLEKRVAVKVLRHGLLLDSDLKRRFIREGVLASRVRHPHVVDVTDVGEDRGQAYLVMEFLEGESLAARMGRLGPMQVMSVVDIVLPIIAGLGAAHRAGIVHRDVKPENIFLARDGERREIPKLLDFGISRGAGTRTQATDEHTILGTAHYMAPEQARAERAIDGRADQYALAIVVYEAISGQLPYVTEPGNVFDLMAEAASGSALPLTARWRSAPTALSDVIARALAGSRDARHATIEDFGHALLPFASTSAARRFRELVDPAGTSNPTLESPPARESSLVSRSGVRVEAPTLAADSAERAAATTGGRKRKVTLRGVPAVRSEPPPAPVETTSASDAALRPTRVRRIGSALRAAGALAVVALAALAALSSGGSMETDPIEESALVGAPRVATSPLAPQDEATSAVLVALTVEPSYAVISLDGRPVAIGTLNTSLPRGGRRHVSVDADGFVRWEADVDDAGLDRALVLRPDPGTPP